MAQFVQMDQEKQAVRFFRKKGGIARTKDILAAGINQRTLYSMRDKGTIDQLSRGLYHLTEMQLPANLGLIIVSQLIPKAIICLISALDYHDITTQIPRFVYVAIPRGMKQPQIKYPKLRIFSYAKKDYEAGAQIHNINGFPVKIFSAEKTVVDCFKFRNKIGTDVAVEALKMCVEEKNIRPIDLIKYAKPSRVVDVMSPYLETIYG